MEQHDRNALAQGNDGEFAFDVHSGFVTEQRLIASVEHRHVFRIDVDDLRRRFPGQLFPGTAWRVETLGRWIKRGDQVDYLPPDMERI